MKESFQWRRKVLAAEEKYFEERRKFFDSQLSSKPLEKILEISEIPSNLMIKSEFDITNDRCMISDTDFNKAAIEDSAITDASQYSEVRLSILHQSDDMEFNKDLHMLADQSSITSANWTMLSRNRQVMESESMMERNFQTDLHLIQHVDNVEGNSNLEGNEDITIKVDDKNKNVNKCTLCTEKFSSYRELVRHFRTHKSFKKFSCDHCTADFFSKSGFLKHLKSHDENRPSLNEKPLICEFKDCKKVFFTKCFYKMHRANHHKGKKNGAK